MLKSIQQKSGYNMNIMVVLFFFSGVSSIIYQIIWQRYLTFSLGSDTISSTIIVSIFMLGLGLGSLAGGWLSDKLNAKSRIRYYAFIEILVAFFGITSHFYLYDFLFITLSGVSLMVSIMLSFVFLIIPTFLMGLTLPLLSKLFDDSLQQMKSFTFILYTVNTLGAAFGAFMPLFFLFPIAGFPTLLYFAVLLNILCALVCFMMRPSQDISSLSCKDHVLNDHKKKAIPLKWFLFAGISGFISISLEVIWFRILTVILKGNAYTFPILLTIFLTGIGLGGALGFYFRKKLGNTELLFVRSQIFIGIYALSSLFLFIYCIDHFVSFQDFREYLYNYAASYRNSQLNTVILHAFIPISLFGIPTFFMGFSFVCLQESIQHNKHIYGRNLGVLLFVNIFCSSVATLLTVFLFLNFFGTTTALIFIGLLTLLILVIHYLNQPRLKVYYMEILLLCSLVLMMILLPSKQRFWSSLYGASNREILIEEDMSSVSSIKIDDNSLSHVFIGGLGQSSLPYNKVLHHIELGVIPILIHPNPSKIAIIGFGSGATLYGIGSNENTQEIDCFEIVSNQYKLIRSYGELKNYKPIAMLFADQRIAFHVKDGRRALVASSKKYDVIEADALRPNSPYAGNLYSVDYFNLLKSKLNKNGIAVTWSPTERVSKTFCMVFPYVVLIGSYLVGSNEPIVIKEDRMLKLQESEFWKNRFRAADISPDLFKGIFSNMKNLNLGNRDHTLDYNTDVFPKDEFLLRWSKSEKF